jgi:2-dehydro-3-deoxyphosphogluconate aldolase/(4S)-4-hydroxy-2-oxoglutarate aldolase
MSDIFDQLTAHGIIPVIAAESPEHALPLADALLEGGLPVAEITFRTAAAGFVIEKIVSKRPEMIVGAGTILTEGNVKAAVDCGARFAVSPGLNPLIVEAAKNAKLPFAPGVATPSDIERALGLGARVLKFFPAGALGGYRMLNALAGPYRHTGIRFLPTGGVNTSNLSEYLASPLVAACGGTWLATRDDIDREQWPTITQRVREAVACVKALEELQNEKP